MLSWITMILILQRLTLDLCTCAVVILHHPSGHLTSLVEHLQNVEVAARITSLLPPALISGSVQLMQYLLLVIIHVSVGNIVWLDLSVDNRYPNVVDLYLRISSVIFQYQIIWRYNKLSSASCRYFISAANDLLEDDSELAYMPFGAILHRY